MWTHFHAHVLFDTSFFPLRLLQNFYFKIYMIWTSNFTSPSSILPGFHKCSPVSSLGDLSLGWIWLQFNLLSKDKEDGQKKDTQPKLRKASVLS